MSRRIHAHVDEEVCVGTRMCGLIAPRAFTYDEARGYSKASNDIVEADDDVLEAAAGCPVGAIVLRDAASGIEIVP